MEAADAQRRRLAGELHEGAERRLATVSEQVAALARDADDAGAGELLEGVEKQLDAARSELAGLARGIRPATLTSGGLAAALTELAARASVPVETRVDVWQAVPAVEVAAYFVSVRCSLTSPSTQMHRTSRSTCATYGGRLAVAVADSTARAAPTPRAAPACAGSWTVSRRSAGGSVVDSPLGGGTSLIAEIPSD